MFSLQNCIKFGNAVGLPYQSPPPLYFKTASSCENKKKENRKKKIEFDFPLTFAENKKYYVPEYKFYDNFYKGYGTIDWKPELVTDNKGNVTFKILKPEVPITLFIEGVSNDGSFIFEEKTISLN